METARLPAPAAAPRYYPHYPPPAPPFLHDLHPALLHRYISYYSEPLAPLDLSVKQTPITPPCTPPPQKADDEPRKNPPKIFRHFEEEEERLSEPEAAEKRRHDDVEDSEDSTSPEVKKLKFTRQFFEDLKSCLPERAATPTTNGKDSPDVVEVREVELRPKKAPQKLSPTPSKKSKAARRLQFDEDKTSPVSGTIIRDLAEHETLVVRKGDIDPAFNVVEITEEAKALIAGIDNKLGRYICRLCRRLYPDAFALAQHRCERIVHIEYRCPECDKVFNCPANLASHRRWHKPRVPGGGGGGSGKAVGTARRTPAPGEPTPLETSAAGAAEGAKFSCKVCGKAFRRQAYLRKHYLAHDAAGKRSLESERDLASPPAPGDEAASAAGAALPERSAFRQVRPEYGAVYSRAEPLRDEDYNTFWGKIPRGEFGFGGDPFYERPTFGAKAARGVYASSVASSAHSEDSRSLDITGSEDEGSGGGGGHWDSGN